MAAGKHGSSEVVISFSSKTMTSYGTQINGFSVEGFFEDTTAFGVTDATSGYAGVRKINPITISGFYDDTATNGPDAVFNTIGTYATMVLTYGNSKTSSFSAAPQKYDRMPGVTKLTRYSVQLMPSGAVTEA